MAALKLFRAPSLRGGRRAQTSGPKRVLASLRPMILEPGACVLSQVLLVDDNLIQLQVRETILRNAGFRVAIATSAESAMALLRTAKQHVGLIVTDHLMPGTGGAEFVRRLRAGDEHMPVIVLSGLPVAEEEIAGFDVAFRLKPLPPAELIDLVRQGMKGQNAA